MLEQHFRSEDEACSLESPGESVDFCRDHFCCSGDLQKHLQVCRFHVVYQL